MCGCVGVTESSGRGGLRLKRLGPARGLRFRGLGFRGSRIRVWGFGVWGLASRSYQRRGSSSCSVGLLIVEDGALECCRCTSGTHICQICCIYIIYVHASI